MLKLINSKGVVITQQDPSIQIDPLVKNHFPCLVELLKGKGGYLLAAEYYSDTNSQPVISRRYLKEWDSPEEKYEFYEMRL